jgi:hypothetical protein
MSGTVTDLVAPSKYELFHLRQILETNRRSIAIYESRLANEKEIEEWAKEFKISPRDIVSLTEKMKSESQRDYDQINSRLSLELTLLHHLVTIRFLDESSPTQVMAHKSNCSFPTNSPILHFPVEPRNRGAIGLRIGDKQKLNLGSGSREFEVVGIDFAELWQIHSHSREPLPTDTSDRPNYSPYHHGGE